MDYIKILERIVAEEGSCCWATPSICRSCPLGSLIRSDNGEFMSCIEALNVDGLSEEDADKRYKDAANRKLADMVIDRVIETS